MSDYGIYEDYIAALERLTESFRQLPDEAPRHVAEEASRQLGIDVDEIQGTDGFHEHMDEMGDDLRRLSDRAQVALMELKEWAATQTEEASR
jgi:hypothetical protein